MSITKRREVLNTLAPEDPFNSCMLKDSLYMEKPYALREDSNVLRKRKKRKSSMSPHKKSGSIPIVVTQKTLRGKKIEDKILSINKYDYYSYEKKISNIIMNFCDEKNIMCINLNKNLSLKPEDFYDYVHFSPPGSKKFSSFLFKELKDKIKFEK